MFIQTMSLMSHGVTFLSTELVDSYTTRMSPRDVGMIWAYDLVWLLILDVFKMAAEAFWDKIKPWDIEHNPALVHEMHEQRLSRRNTNSLTEQAKINKLREGRLQIAADLASGRVKQG